ncbi:polyisoprenoid diphosphate/phosphate phosphohydrolase PLPP6-like [Littorina saxatilis]|uniref:Phosphatidic acid phosphatase type 2/haloperoxidase domain-containing protein n=1 Tax=Littorina saxatilis TaxID=31220 RepID=A0AAN9AYF7_9CAEN
MRKRPNENTGQNPTEQNQGPTENAQQMKRSPLDSIIALDQKWTAALSVCANEDSPLVKLRPLMKALEISLHGVLWLAGTAIAFFMCHRINDIELLVNLFFLLILDLIVVGSTKLMFRRGRPTNNRMDMFATVSVDIFSFPSGHSTRAAMVTCFLVGKVVKKRYSPFVIALCGCLGLSRIMLGRHHILDVVFGLIIGVLEFVCYLPFWVPFSVVEPWLDDLLSHLHL